MRRQNKIGIVIALVIMTSVHLVFSMELSDSLGSPLMRDRTKTWNFNDASDSDGENASTPSSSGGPTSSDDELSSSIRLGSTARGPKNIQELNVQMKVLVDRMRSILKDDESRLGSHIRGYKAPTHPIEAGEEHASVLALRVRAVNNLIDKAQRICKAYGSEFGDVQLSEDFEEYTVVKPGVKDGKAMRNASLEKFEKSIGKSTEKQVAEWQSILASLYDVSDSLTKEINSKNLVTVLSGTKELMDNINTQMPRMHDMLTQRKTALSDGEIQELNAHFESVVKARKILGLLTRKLKHGGWATFMTSAYIAPNPTVSLVGGIVLKASTVAMLAKIIVLLAITASVSYKIYKTYHKVKIVSMMAQVSSLEALKQVAWSDFLDFIDTVKNIKNSFENLLQETVSPAIKAAVQGAQEQLGKLGNWIDITLLDKEKIDALKQEKATAKENLIALIEHSIREDGKSGDVVQAYMDMVRSLKDADLIKLAHQRDQTAQKQKRANVRVAPSVEVESLQSVLLRYEELQRKQAEQAEQYSDRAHDAAYLHGGSAMSGSAHN